MKTLGAYTVVHNCERILYPWKASILSSLALADRVFVCDAMSDDGTWEYLQEWAVREPRLEIMRHSWGTHHTILPTICNGILENRTLQAMDFAIQIQADEVVAEWSIKPTRDWLNNETASVVLGCPHYTHFCPDVHTTWPFIYERKAVLSRNSSRLRWSTAKGGDACSLVGAEWHNIPLEVFHYGKVQTGRQSEALHKEVTMQAMYKDLGFPDPKVMSQVQSGKLDYMQVFDPTVFTPYQGNHPYFALEWIAERAK